MIPIGINFPDKFNCILESRAILRDLKVMTVRFHSYGILQHLNVAERLL